MTTGGDWPSTACWDLFAWLKDWNVPPLVPAHLRAIVEPGWHEAVTSTLDCPLDADLAYSHLDEDLKQARSTAQDFFLSAGQSNGYSSFWGFGLRSGDLVVFIQVVSGGIDEGFVPDIRPFTIFMETLWNAVNQPSLLARPVAAVRFSEFREKRALVWRTPPEDNSPVVALQAQGLDIASYSDTKLTAVQGFTDAINELYSES